MFLLIVVCFGVTKPRLVDVPQVGVVFVVCGACPEGLFVGWHVDQVGRVCILAVCTVFVEFVPDTRHKVEVEARVKDVFGRAGCFARADKASAWIVQAWDSQTRREKRSEYSWLRPRRALAQWLNDLECLGSQLQVAPHTHLVWCAVFAALF
jgi:hypothetical protein